MISSLRDSRYFQIAFLLTFLTYGCVELDLDVSPLEVSCIIVTALLTQAICLRLFGVQRRDYKSAFISSLSLCLLLRSSSIAILIGAAFISIASKFLVRFRGKHIFNPTNLGIALPVMVSDAAWISPGQWGSMLIISGFALLAGFYVAAHASRADISLAFLFCYLTFLLMRALYLGDPLIIPAHQLESGALLIFCFFMISDPMTTPNHRIARILFAAMVAALAYYIRFRLYNPNALIYALVILSPTVPVFDLVFPAAPYRWKRPSSTFQPAAT